MGAGLAAWTLCGCLGAPGGPGPFDGEGDFVLLRGVAWDFVYYSPTDAGGVITLAWRPPAVPRSGVSHLLRKLPGDTGFTLRAVLEHPTRFFRDTVALPVRPEDVPVPLPLPDPWFPLWFDTAKARENPSGLLKGAAGRALPWNDSVNLQYRVEWIPDGDEPVSRSPVRSVTARRADAFRPRIALEAAGLRQGVLSIGDTVAFILRYRDPRGPIRRIAWRRQEDGTLLRETVPPSAEGADTLIYIGEEARNILVDVGAVFQAGDSLGGQVLISVIDDLPRAYAGRDSSHSIGDPVRLTGHAHDGFSRRFDHAWDIGGTGDFRRTSTAETTFTAPDREGEPFPCVLKVTDDDGYEARDTVRLTFFRAWPGNWVMSGRQVIDSQHVAQAHATFDFLGRIWVVGGVPSAGRSLVRSTADGIAWENHAASGGLPRVYHAAHAVFRDRLWQIGGERFDTLTRSPSGEPSGEVWSSGDGREWAREPDFPSPRYGAACLAYAGKLWVLGGTDGSGILEDGDVWSSPDGKAWTRVTASAAWRARGWPGAAVHADRMWIVGGRALSPGLPGSAPDLADAWSSADGLAWIAATTAAAFAGRSAHALAAHDGKLWVIGGAPARRTGDVWYSEDGARWTEATGTAPLPPIYFHDALVRGGKIWVVGTGTGSAASSPVWLSR